MYFSVCDTVLLNVFLADEFKARGEMMNSTIVTECFFEHININALTGAGSNSQIMEHRL